MSINQQQKAGNKMRIALENRDPITSEELAKLAHKIYIVSRDAPEYLGGSMVTMWVQILEDSYGNAKFGLLPKTYEILHVWGHENGQMIWFGQVEDHFKLMGDAVNVALDVSHYCDHEIGIFVITESGTNESHISSVYSYMAERGFPF